MNRLLVICGPTATGKTSLGIFLAKKLVGEIVSADSRQVYRGMDIGTGKDLPVGAKFVPYEVKVRPLQSFNLGYYLFDGIPVWLLDVIRPDCRFSVADYVQCASVVIEDIWRRGRLPIIVGGTGFYIKGLIDGIGTLGVKPDWEMRTILGDYDITILGKMLQELNPERWERMNESDRQNPRRLVRAIEIAMKRQNVIHNTQNKLKCKTDEILIIGLKAPFKELYQRIDRRVEERIERGVEEEIRKLLKKGFNWKNSVLGTTLGYQEWKDFFGGGTAKEEIIQLWKFNEHRYARRQMTWFKKAKRINWFDITKVEFDKDVVKIVQAWYSKTNDAEN